MSQWYRELFQNYGIKYDNKVFTGGTLGECDFIEAELYYNRELRILDIGCRTGRHSIELSQRGYQVTGIDLSDSMLQRTREKAKAQNLAIDFQLQDARQLPFLNQFDAVIMLCEGAFPLMETDEMNFMILQNAANALRPQGKLIFTTLNGLFPLFHSVRSFSEEFCTYLESIHWFISKWFLALMRPFWRKSTNDFCVCLHTKLINFG